VLLKRGEDSFAARAFLDFMHTHSARQIIASTGYDLPD